MPRNKGFVSWLILIIIALALLKYFLNWSIIDVANSEQGKNTINYVKDVLNIVWFYIKPAVMFIWRMIMSLWSAKQSV
ncbi:MAG: hypothetical protein AAB586_01355 [Patescibacteria group bacterium]